MLDEKYSPLSAFCYEMDILIEKTFDLEMTLRITVKVTWILSIVQINCQKSTGIIDIFLQMTM